MTPRKGFLRRAVERLLRSAELDAPAPQEPGRGRRWRLVQLESAIACHLDCVMCPWHDVRRELPDEGLMPEEVWGAVAEHLAEIAEFDFSGGGEPLLQPHLVDWVAEASAAGCRTGFLTNAYYLDEEMARRLVVAGIDWLATSIDGASRRTYEEIRKGSSFDRVTANMTRLAELRADGRPATMVNFVLMERNLGELEDVVRLVADLGIDRLNFKQADVIRGERGKGAGLFGRTETREIRRMRSAVEKASRLARRLGVRPKIYPFTPTELPVCMQEPHRTFFVRHDGLVSACISLAYGGPTTFFGEDARMPTVEYGRLPEQDLLGIWEGANARRYRANFEARIAAYERALGESVGAKSPAALEKAMHRGIEVMPEACEGCRNCHYLYDV